MIDCNIHHYIYVIQIYTQSFVFFPIFAHLRARNPCQILWPLPPILTWIGTICGIGLMFRASRLKSLFDYSPWHLTFGCGCWGPYLPGRHINFSHLARQIWAKKSQFIPSCKYVGMGTSNQTRTDADVLLKVSSA